MTISMYQASIPVFQARLKSLARILKKAEENAAERKINPDVFLNARIAPDMYPLVRQVQIACDHAKNAPFRLSGKEVVRIEDTEATFADLQARIARTIELLGTFKAADIDGSEGKQIAFKIGGHDMAFNGLDYLQQFAAPNFYFHMTTAYSILRHNGVPLGKTDFFQS